MNSAGSLSKISIHQSVHGYSDGHSLLASSLTLDPLDRRKMMVMSDLAGPGFVEGFDPYIQGYSLPQSGAYVVARTWSAPEMRRPGCVWTHSLIIPQREARDLGDLNKLLPLFQRPVASESYKSFETPLLLEIPSRENLEFGGLNLRFFQRYFDLSASQLILLADSNRDYERQVLMCWNLVWPSLKKTIELSTAVLATKQIDPGNFFVGIAPRSSRRIVEKAGVHAVTIEEFNETEVQIGDAKSIVRLGDLTAFARFIAKFGQDLRPDRAIEPRVFSLSHTLATEVLDFDGFVEDLIAVATISPDSSLLRHIIQHDTAEFPGLRSVSEQSALAFVLTRFDSKIVHLNFDYIRMRLNRLVQSDPKSARGLLEHLASENGTSPTATAAAVELFVALLKHNVKEKLAVPDVVVKRAFLSHKELFDLPSARRELINHYTVLDDVLSESDLSGNSRIRIAELITDELGRPGASVALKLVSSVSFEALMALLLNRGARLGLTDRELATVLGRFRPEIRQWLSSKQDAPEFLVSGFFAGADFESEADSQLAWQLTSRALKEKSHLPLLPKDAIVFALCQAFRGKYRNYSEVIELSFHVVYMWAKSDNLAQQSIQMLSHSTVKPYFWNGWDQCARLRNSLLALLKEERINPYSFVKACYRVDLLDEVLHESEGFIFTDRREIKKRLKVLLKDPRGTPEAALSLIERYIDEKWGW